MKIKAVAIYYIILLIIALFIVGSIIMIIKGILNEWHSKF